MRRDDLLPIVVPAAVDHNVDIAYLLRQVGPKCIRRLIADINIESVLLPLTCIRIKINPDDQRLGTKKFTPNVQRTTVEDTNFLNLDLAIDIFF